MSVTPGPFSSSGCSLHDRSLFDLGLVTALLEGSEVDLVVDTSNIVKSPPLNVLGLLSAPLGDGLDLRFEVGQRCCDISHVELEITGLELLSACTRLEQVENLEKFARPSPRRAALPTQRER